LNVSLGCLSAVELLSKATGAFEEFEEQLTSDVEAISEAVKCLMNKTGRGVPGGRVRNPHPKFNDITDKTLGSNAGRDESENESSSSRSSTPTYGSDSGLGDDAAPPPPGELGTARAESRETRKSNGRGEQAPKKTRRKNKLRPGHPHGAADDGDDEDDDTDTVEAILQRRNVTSEEKFENLVNYNLTLEAGNLQMEKVRNLFFLTEELSKHLKELKTILPGRECNLYTGQEAGGAGEGNSGKLPFLQIRHSNHDRPARTAHGIS
jgi:hypothetical protein